MAYEARARFPESQLHITNEIIHNPSVNEVRRLSYFVPVRSMCQTASRIQDATRLQQVASDSVIFLILCDLQKMHEMEVKFIEAEDDGTKDFSGVESGDVVILPAFGASVEEMRLLNDRKVQIIDTTCPWVSKVWTAVDKQASQEHTSIIHGKYSHEETVATASFAGNYLIVKDLDEANYVADYILNGGDKAEFMSKFSNAGMSPQSWYLPHLPVHLPICKWFPAVRVAPVAPLLHRVA